MQIIPSLDEFIKGYRLQLLREELGKDVDALLDEDEEDTKPREGLMSYVPPQEAQKPITIRSGYTTQPDTTTCIDTPEEVYEAS